MTRSEPLLLPLFFASLLHVVIFMLLITFADIGGQEDLLSQEDLLKSSLKARLSPAPAVVKPRPAKPKKSVVVDKPNEKKLNQEQAAPSDIEQLIDDLSKPREGEIQVEQTQEEPVKTEDSTKVSSEKRSEALAYYRRNQDLVERNFNTGTAAQRQIFEGLVTRLKIFLDEEGSLLYMEIISSSGNEVFDTEAERAVRRIEQFIIPDDTALRERYFREITMEFKLR